MATFIDLFAGAGGFSEGFLQAEVKDKTFDFLLASDINSTCEVTHRMRYNRQLGLDTQFITKDITDPDFVECLLDSIRQSFGDRKIDVLVGGPPCQSFSLAGERKKNDKKDDLFSYYLKVIEAIRPKYFVMENVKGILTKDNGKVKERILREIRNIVDYDQLSSLLALLEKKSIDGLSKEVKQEYLLVKKALELAVSRHVQEVDARSMYLAMLKHLEQTKLSEEEKKAFRISMVKTKNELPTTELESYYKALSEKFVDAYRNQKDVPESNRNVIRQGLALLSRQSVLDDIKRRVVKEINHALLKESEYKKSFDEITDSLSEWSVVEKMFKMVDELMESANTEQREVLNLVRMTVTINTEGVFHNLDRLKKVFQKEPDVIGQIGRISLYHINGPMELVASDYGVPQNRHRVVFLGCRNDQKLITSIPATVEEKDKVSSAEAIGDLDFIGVNETKTDYDLNTRKKFEKTKYGGIKRTIDGKLHGDDSEMRTFSEWSRIGRLSPKRFPKLENPDRDYTSMISCRQIGPVVECVIKGNNPIL